jgi:hypothetical protein
MQTLKINGVDYPVSDDTPVTNPEGWTFNEERAALSRWQGGQLLTERERAWLTARTNRDNMHRVVAFLAGRDFRDIGPTLDCVHGQRWSPDTCGCVVDEVFHHFTKGEPSAHRTARACRHHKHLADPHSLRDTCRVESITRGAVRQAVAEELGVDVGEVYAEFDDARALLVDHPKLRELNAAATARVDAKIAAAAGIRKVRRV